MGRPEFTMTITLGQALQILAILAALAAFGLRYEERLASAETRIEATAEEVEKESAEREKVSAALTASIDALARTIEEDRAWNDGQRGQVWQGLRELTERVSALAERLAVGVAILERVEDLVDRMTERQAEIDRRVRVEGAGQ